MWPALDVQKRGRVDAAGPPGLTKSTQLGRGVFPGLRATMHESGPSDGTETFAVKLANYSKQALAMASLRKPMCDTEKPHCCSLLFTY